MQLNNQLPTPLQEYVHKSRYARWLSSENRRESWAETVDRYVSYFANKFPHFPKEEIKEAHSKAKSKINSKEKTR